MAKIIRCTIDPDSLSQAIKEIEDYKRDLNEKTHRLREAIGERIGGYASWMFNTSVVDDALGAPRYASVQVEVDDQEQVTVVIASGPDAVFVEFGAGVYHNTSVGSSPHPEGERLGFTIGSYGKGNGAKKLWGYWAGDELVLTHGTPAAMPMYTAMKMVCSHIDEIAREVFA